MAAVTKTAKDAPGHLPYQLSNSTNLQSTFILTLGAPETTAESDPLSGPPENRDLAPHFY